MKVLFLDIDGVLNSASWFQRRGKPKPEHGVPGSDEYMALRQLDPEAVALMNTVIERTGCRVVLSSTWRRAHGMIATRFALRRRGATFELIDCTPDCAQMGPGSVYVARERGAEIAEWLQYHPEVTRFAIVDDDGDMGPLLNRLVQTTWDEGLKSAHADKLVEMLGAKDVDARAS